MPFPTTLVVELTDEQREHLEKSVRKRTATQRKV